jgi:hypothetical protein
LLVAPPVGIVGADEANDDRHGQRNQGNNIPQVERPVKPPIRLLRTLGAWIAPMLRLNFGLNVSHNTNTLPHHQPLFCNTQRPQTQQKRQSWCFYRPAILRENRKNFLAGARVCARL